MGWLSLVLIVPGLICAYAFLVRPLLKAIPQLKQFYADADGFWAKVSALGWHSATIAWSYFMIVVGLIMNWIEPLATALGDPDIKSQVTNILQADPKILAYAMMAISTITIAARLRSIAKGA